MSNFLGILAPSIIFYFLIILSIGISFTIKFFMFVEHEDDNNLYLPIYFHILLLGICVIAVSPFFGLYESYGYVSTTQSILITLILSVSFGLLLYMILLKIIAYLRNKDNFKFHAKDYYLKKHSKYGLFILMLLIISIIFTSQSVSSLPTIESNQKPDYNSLAVSADKTTMAMILQKGTTVYLLIKDINDTVSKTYSLCQTAQWCLYDNPLTNNLKVLLITNKYVFLYEDNGIFQENNVYVFSLGKKEIINEIILHSLYNGYAKPLTINSVLYIGYIDYVYANKSFVLQLYNVIEDNTTFIPYRVPDYNQSSSNLQINDVAISPDFTKLAVSYARNDQSFINFYKITKNETDYINTQKLVGIFSPYSPFSFQWTKNNTALYYSYYSVISSTSHHSIISKFDFQDNISTLLIKIPNLLYINTLTSNGSYLLTGSLFNERESIIYSIKNDTVRSSFNCSCYILSSDNSLTHLLVLDKTLKNLQLESYKSSTNSLILKKEILTNHNNNKLEIELLSNNQFIDILLAIGLGVSVIVLIKLDNNELTMQERNHET